MKINPDKVAALIGEIAQDVIAPRFGKLQKSDVRAKSAPNDLVTVVDEEAERALEHALKGIHPGALFVGEESVAKEPSTVEALLGDAPCWVVDPLDGTRNFVRGVPEFGSIVAYVEGGRTRMGWIYAVPEQSCAIAVEGEGASWAGEPVRPAPPTRERPLGLRSIFWLPDSERAEIKNALERSFETKNGHCSAYSYLKLARGEVDFKISSRIHPWDHLAGALLLSELGARTAFLKSGEPLAPRLPVDGALLAVAPGRDWREIASALTV